MKLPTKQYRIAKRLHVEFSYDTERAHDLSMVLGMLFLSQLVGHRVQQTVALCLALSLVAGCATTTVVSATPDDIVREVRRGDLVNIVTKDAQNLRFHVEKISTARISGEGYSVPYDLISEISVEKNRGDQARAVTLGVIVVVAILAATWAIWAAIDSATDKAVTGS